MSKNQNILTLEYPYNDPSASSTKAFLSPPLPPCLDCLLDQPFNQSASLEVDCWLWYIQQEFEGVQE
jgi:hypothetical protein